MLQRNSTPPEDRPVIIAGSGRCGSTLLQSVLNTNLDFLIWGEHNGFLRQISAAYFGAEHPRFPDKVDLSAEQRIKKLRDGRRWPAWDNLCSDAEFLERFRTFIRSLFADPTGHATRWGFKEIRYGQNAQDHTLRLMFDCFPETRLIILVREPTPTIFSMLSHWAFANQRQGNIHLEELDQRILWAADLWNSQYLHLHSLSQAYAANCLAIHYEELLIPRTYQKLAKFLRTSLFDYLNHIVRVRDASNKTDATAVLIRRRMEFLQGPIAQATCHARAVYGYTTPADLHLRSTAG